MIDLIVRDAYKNINWNSFLREELGPAGRLSEVKPVLDRIKNIFDSLIENPIVFSLSPAAKNILEAQLNYFLGFKNEILSFSDVSQRGNIISRIKDAEWNIISGLGILVSYCIDKQPLLDPKVIIEEDFKTLNQKVDSKLLSINESIEDSKSVIKGLEKAASVAERLLNEQSNIEVAVSKIEEWNKNNEKAIQVILKSNATDAAQKAEEHATYKIEFVDIWLFRKIPILKKITQPSWAGSFGWFVGSIISGIVVLAIISYFVFLPGDAKIETVLLRITSILVPGYFTVFCSQQYLNHRRLYESYKFKDVSLQTMINLRKQLTDDYSSKEKVLEKSLDVIFSEPPFSDSIKYDKNLLLELFKLIRK